MIYLVLLSLIGYCAFLVAIEYTNSSKAPIIAVCIISILEYLGALLGFLLPATYIVFVTGFILLIVAIIIKIKYIKKYIQQLIQPGFVIFFISIYLLYRLSQGVVVSSFDEFSHWGLYPKYLLIYDKIPTDSNVVPFFYLPPIVSLIEYYFARMLSGTEGMLYWGKIVFTMSALSCAVGNLKWKQIIKVIVSFSLAFLILLKYDSFQFFNLYTDALTAVIAYAAFAFYANSERTYSDILKTLPIIFIIPLMRESAPILGIFVFILVLFDQLALNGANVKGSLSNIIKTNRNVLISFIIIFTVIISSLTWNAFLSIHQDDSVYKIITRGNPRTISDTLKYISNYFEQLSYIIIGNPATRYKLMSTLPFTYLIVLTLLLLSSLLLFNNKKKYLYKSITTYACSISFVTIIYVIGLLYIYLHRFSQQEANNFASFSRYMSTISIFIMLCTTTYLICIEQKIDHKLTKKSINYAILFIMVMSIVTTNPQRLNILVGRVLNYVGFREEIYERTHDIIPILNENTKVYVIIQEPSSIVNYATEYELMAHTNHRNHHLGSNGYDITCTEFRNILINENYDYVYIGKADEILWETYGELFNATSDYKLYRVEDTKEFLLTSIK